MHFENQNIIRDGDDFMRDQKGEEINAIWERPVMISTPDKETEKFSPVISLDGIWKFTDTPPANYWENIAETSAWDNVIVPGELNALGYDIRRSKEYVYKKLVDMPLEIKNKKIILKIGMAYEYSKVWVNGKFVREHGGGYTTFDCDITDFVVPGQPAFITIMCMNRPDTLVDWPRPENTEGFCGLIDKINLIIVPQNFITRFHYETDFDDLYKNATLKLTVAMHFYNTICSEIKLNMLDPYGNQVDINPSSIRLSRENAEITIEIPVIAPYKWDAEHPNLYSLKAVLIVDGKNSQTFSRRVGFRKAEIIDDNLYINGVLTKLRGAARYSHDPILGKTFSDEYLETEIKAVKYANMNFVRSSAYPEREKYYELCDIYGIYVEECAPVTFQRAAWDSQRDMVVKNSSDIPNYKAEYMNQFAEMIERDKSHPSIIIREYANESDWGVNFQTELDYMKAEDPKCLSAGTWNNGVTDIASYHYPQYNEIFDSGGLYDEYAHVATHAVKAIKRDPGIRNAWGLSIHKGWNTLYPAEGVIGAAIFALGDFTYMRPDGKIFAEEFGQWGLLDTWLREKPEFWLTKKAYSPVRIADKSIENPGKEKQLDIPVKNWFSNTNFNEINFYWHVGLDSGNINTVNLAPNQEGVLSIPQRQWQDGEVIHISAFDRQGMLIDIYALTISGDKQVKNFPEVKGPAPAIIEDRSSITISGSNFNITFSKATGLITKGDFNGTTMLKSGPYLNLYGMYYKSAIFKNDRKGEFELKFSGWQMESIKGDVLGNEALIHIKGYYPGASHKDMWGFEYGYEPINVEFEISVDGAGLICTKYTILNPPEEMLSEIGIAYVLTDDINRLKWDRDALYSVYPDDHIGRPSGTAFRYRGYGTDTYRERPEWSWSQDETNFVVFGSDDKQVHCTNDFRSTRENIWYASLIHAQSDNRVRVESDGKSVSVRAGLAKDEDPGLPEGIKLNMNNSIFYDLGNGSNPNKTGDGSLGNYTYPEIYLQPGYTNYVRMRITDYDYSKPDFEKEFYHELKLSEQKEIKNG